MRDGKPETPGEKVGYYVLGGASLGLVLIAAAKVAYWLATGTW